MTLSQLSATVRRAFPFIVVAIIAVLMLYAGAAILISKNRKAQNETITLNTKFGKLPPLTLEETLPFPEVPRFVLENVEGRPVTATAAAAIYFVPNPRTRFGYLSTMYQMAKAVGFDTTVTSHSITGDTGSFKDETRDLSIDVKTFNFTYSTQYELRPELFDLPQFRPEESIISDAKDFLQKMDRYPEILAQGNEHAIYLHFDASTKEFTPVKSSRGANVVEVDFFIPDFDPYPIVSPKYFTSQNYVVLTYAAGVPQVIKAQIRNFEYDKNSIGSYPIKTGDQAFEDLKNKKGFIVGNQNPSSTIKITDMYLAYLDNQLYSPYLQPVYVFLGENSFVAYVAAVQDEWVGTTSK